MSTGENGHRPPPTNQGGRREEIDNSPSVFVHLDWISYTVPFASSPAKAARRALMPLPDFKLLRHWGEGLGSYNTVIETACGALLAWHCEHPEFKIFTSLSGDVLQRLGSRQVFGRQLIEYALTRKARFSRIDVAIDIFNCGARVDHIREVFERGGAITNAKAGGSYKGIRHDASKQGGETLYVGSPKSERQLRVYNKAAEQGVEKDWLRIELVSRKELAHLLAEAIAREGVPDAGRQAIRQFFRLPSSTLVGTGLDWAIGGDSASDTGDGSPAVVIRHGYPVVRKGGRGGNDTRRGSATQDAGRNSYEVP